jgi:hypothetical protein
MPILAVRTQDSPSAHCLDIRMFRAVGVAHGYATQHKSNGGELETHAMTTIDQSAVRN